MAAGDAQLVSRAREFAGQSHKLFIGGDWVDAQSDGFIETRDPSTSEVLGAAPDGTAGDIDQAVRAARRCFEDDWSRRDPRERSRMLLRLADVIESNREILATLETMDNGTLIAFTPNVVVDLWINVLEYFAGWPTKMAGQTLPAPANYKLPGREGILLTLREPVGVVGAILPWNAPATFLINKAAPALAAGCTVVAKPAEQTPLTTLFLASLFEEAGFPPGALNVVTGYGETAGAALARHEDVNKISFTGSSDVGKSIARDAAGNLKRLTLELGGKSPFVVMADADLDHAAQTAAFNGYFQAGQFCMCPSRILVDKKVLDPFLDKLTTLANGITVGAAIDPAAQMGPLITDQQLQRVSAYVDSAREEGAEMLLGGDQPAAEGYFHNPTIFFNGDTRLRIAREEIFGPVLLVVPFDGGDLDEVARVANETRYGLAASVWTRDIATGHRMIRKLRAGVVGVNSHAVIDAMAPFGGVKDSGLGREFGQEGYESFLETKTASVFY